MQNDTQDASVLNGEIQRLSVSQMMTYDAAQSGGCARKWYFDKVLHVPRPPDQALLDGTRFHKEIERYLLGEISAQELSPTVRAGVHLMPQPNNARLLVEQDVSDLLTLGGVAFRGSIDCVNRSSVYVDALGCEQQDPQYTIEVIDWKSTANLKYAKRGLDLIDNAQMIGYAEYIRRRYPSAAFVRLSHVYFQKRGSYSAQKSTALFAVDVIRDKWQSLNSLVDQMRASARAATVADVPPNFNSCDAFKGCPYRTMCPRPQSVVLAGYFGNRETNTMGLFADRNKQAQQPQHAPAFSDGRALATVVRDTATQQATAQPIAPVNHNAGEHHVWVNPPQVEQAKKQVHVLAITNPPGLVNAHDAAILNETAKLIAEEAAAKQPPALASYGNCVQCSEPVNEVNGSRSISGRVKHLGCKAGILPPDATKIDGLPGVALDGSQQVAPSVQKAADALGLGSPAPVASAPAREAKASEEKAKKPRTKKAPASDGATPLNSALVADRVLLIDCNTDGLDFDANAIIGDVAAQLCKHFGVPDLELAQEKPLAFGGWKGALRVAVAEAPEFDQPGVYRLRIDSDFSRIAAEALRKRFPVVIQGTL